MKKDENQIELEPIKELPHKQQKKDIDFLSNLDVSLTVELGSTNLPLRRILSLQKGSIIKLDKIAGEEFDIYINDVYLTSGEIVVISDNLSIRINDIYKKKKF